MAMPARFLGGGISTVSMIRPRGARFVDNCKQLKAMRLPLTAAQQVAAAAAEENGWENGRKTGGEWVGKMIEKRAPDAC